jgi:hypothetical protein
MKTDNGIGEIKAKLAEAQEWLAALEKGDMHIGAPFEGRTEAKIHELRRQIDMYESMLEQAAPR